MSSELLTFQDVESRMKLVMQFFGNDTCRFAIHLSNYLNKNMKRYRAHMAEKDKNEVKQGEEKIKEVEKVTTDMEKKTTDYFSSWGLDALTKEITSALEKDASADLMTLLSGGKKLDKEKLEMSQRIRRASALGMLSSSISSEDKRKMSALDKNSLVLEEALKLAETEEAEDAALEDDWEQEEFKAGDEVIIIEGENGGLFGSLQHSTGGIFGIFDPSVREDEEGNYGVDVCVSAGNDEGFWIHPEAMQHKKYLASDEVKVIDGINIGRTGSIQSDGDRIRIDDGSYGVDVTMEDGSVEGYWIHPTSMQLIDETGRKKVEVKDDEDLAELDNYDFLPYIAFPGDEMDEALSEELNTFEIDINIKRVVANSGRIVYRWGGKRHLVRYIHGVLLVKEEKVWNKLTPVLQKFAGKN